ncbi:phosphoglycolate phosphatase [Roseiarcus fermentans]|uniref:phosphoglycolate phosphatase n=1 Tax=Roseiarcus fermentans TaxID=1473586 RepID=A0A366FMY1_9HYPH|nr:HAD hydrolase-like protein [Roseiarcus fermentans]RBP16063.1 phosphoglycolate phosphatase [Roseiarcus fermentans]
MPPLAVLFDLDGTLVQTREASWKIFARTNAAFKLGIDSQQDFFRLLEDNLFSGLRRRCRDDEHARQVAQHFFAQLDADYAPDLVPGMVDVIHALAGACSLAVVSSNSTSTIRRLLTRAKIAHCFSHVFGGDVEPDKRAVVRRFLADQSYLVSRDCSPAYREGHSPAVASASDLVLITDTTGDVKHAVECGVRAVGVSWGMHPEAELLAAGAEFVAVWPQELIAYLTPGGNGRSCGVPARSNCGCRAEPPQSCSCEAALMTEAGALRRQRTRSRAEGLAATLSEAPPPAPTPATPRARQAIDAQLSRALARLRATRRPPRRRQT